MDNSFKIKKGVNVEPTALVPTIKGDLTVDTASGDMKYHNGTVVATVLTDSNTATITNKTISGNDNTITDIPSGSINPLTANRAVATDGAGHLVASPTSDTELGYVDGVTSPIQAQIDSKQPTGNYITSLTGDVTATGPGAAAATVVSVGGSSAADVNAATVATLAATDANTPSTIVKRDANGDFDISSVTMVELGSTPSTPAANTDKLYFKTDGKFYKLNDAGVEKEIGGNPVFEMTLANNQASPANVTGFLVDPSENAAFTSEISMNRRYAAEMIGLENTPYIANLPVFDDGINKIVKLDSSLIVTGNFSTVNGVTHRRIAKLNSDGTANSTFLTNMGVGFNSAVLDVAVGPSNEIVVVGAFSGYGAFFPVNRVVKLSSSGVLDSTFVANLDSISQPVRAVAIQPDGKIVIGGDFTTLGVLTRNRLVRLNADGTEDVAFYANLGTGFDASVYSIKIDSLGRIVVGGTFTDLNGNSRNFFVRLNSDGTEDTTFYTNAILFGNISSSGGVQIVEIQSDDKVIFGGQIIAFAGLSPYGVVRVNADGTRDVTFISNVAAGFGSLPTDISSVKVGPSGKIAIGGSFDNYDGFANLDNITHLNSDGTTDTVFAGNYSEVENFIGGLGYTEGGLFIGRDTNSSLILSRLGNDPTELLKQQTLRGVYRSNSSVWEIGAAVSIGDDAGVTLSMLPSGQLQYTTTNISGTPTDSYMRFTIQPL